MGRAHLSTAYGIDDVPARKSPCPEPPRYIDALFDLDVDAPDAVYEAFLTGEEGDHGGFPIAPRETAASPVESIESDEASSEATTQPSTRVPSPVRQDRGQRADSPVDRGVRVMELLEPLTNARVAATPAIQAALAEGVNQVGPLVHRLITILRPHIEAALAPFTTELPEVRFLGQMYERSLVLDMLGSSSVTRLTTGFPANNILAALDATAHITYVTHEPRVVRPRPVDESVERSRTVQASDFQVTTRAALPAGFRLTEDPRTTGSASPPPLGRASPSLWPRRGFYSTSRAPRPMTFAMDVDSDDDARSTGSSSFSSGPFSARSGTPTFAPRVFRARDGHSRQSPSDNSTRAAFLPTHHYITPEPLR